MRPPGIAPLNRATMSRTPTMLTAKNDTRRLKKNCWIIAPRRWGTSQIRFNASCNEPNAPLTPTTRDATPAMVANEFRLGRAPGPRR